MGSCLIRMHTWSKQSFNPRLTNVFFVTRLTRRGVVATPPPWIFATKVFMNLVLVSMNRYWALLTIDISITKIGQGVTKLWHHMSRATPKIGIFREKWVKIQNFAKKVLNIGISPVFTFVEGNDNSNIPCKFQLHIMHIFFKMATFS